ncbi:hypothetical protein Q8F55_000045 [Vanrija albida]|uniref:F-box domain-containing protein n=1 Tax=Vanrija albida TaxID=181172 RepID=A0ABR3QC44_9TREE
MPTTIDHTAYPYLIDIIIEFASVPAQLKLRQTSRSFRERIDARRCKHVVLLSIKGTADGWLHAPSASNPFEADGERLLRVHGFPLGLSAPAARTLDLVGRPQHAHEPPYVLLSQFSTITTFRRFGEAVRRPYPELSGHVHTLVDCTQGGEIALVRGVRRYILHSLWDEAAPYAQIWFPPPGRDKVSLGGVEEITLVLWPFKSTSVERRRLIDDLLWMLRERAGCPSRFTVVGLEKVHPSQVKYGSQLETAQRGDVRALADALDGYDSRPYLTLEQWQESLSDEERDILCPPGLGNCRPPAKV